MKICSTCGAPVADSIETCFKCGSPMDDGAAGETPSLMERFIDEPSVQAIKPEPKPVRPAPRPRQRSRTKMVRPAARSRKAARPAPRGKKAARPIPALEKVAGGGDEAQIAARIYQELLQKGAVGGKQKQEAEKLLEKLGAELPSPEALPLESPAPKPKEPAQDGLDELPTDLPETPSGGCPGCSKPVDTAWTHCPYCGQSLGGCPKCGAAMEPGWTFCPKCGAQT